MKRFYKEVAADLRSAGWEVLLDGRPVKTPARAALALPYDSLAEAIVAEWAGQGEIINPRSMPLTGLANAAIDRVAPDPQAFAATLARYGESDLLCYRAEGPDGLVARQADQWDPLLSWARGRYDVDFEVVAGIMHRPQPRRTVEQLGRAIAARSGWELAGLSPIVTVGGSLVIALALFEGAASLNEAWDAATLDERWQAEQWGEDAEATAMLQARRDDFEAGYRFLHLLR